MKKAISISVFLFFQQIIFGQSAHDLIEQVFKTQHELKTLSYTLFRRDTLTSGQTRILTGMIKTRIVPDDSLYGFWFWTKRDSLNIETVYDGNAAVEINHDKKEYQVFFDKQSLSYLPYRFGQVVFKELLRLDTAQATAFDLAQDGQYYYLTMHLPDIPAYDVRNRYKRYSIDKKIMLPTRMTNHQTTVGKIQDLYYEIKDIWINDESHAYDFSSQQLPADYRQLSNTKKPEISALLNKPAPPFNLVSAHNEQVGLPQTAGKTTLLDFSELWCGPCLLSMPKVQALYDQYKTKGLQIYGVSFEKEQIGALIKMMEKLNILFPVFVGDSAMKKAYEVSTIPKYVVIDNTGQISAVIIGYSDELETAIGKLLGK